jgi:hypothetical protein
MPASLPARAQPRWKKPMVGLVYSGVAVAGGSVVVLDHESNKKDFVRCLNADSGEEVWKLAYDNTGEAMAFGSCPRATPVIRNGAVYTLGARGHLRALDLAAIHFVSHGQVIPVPPAQIRSLANTGEEEAGGSVFRTEMWGGGTVTGQIRETLLPIRIGDKVWQVPSRDVVGIAVPRPALPDGLRDRIAQLIRDLGHPDQEKREAASRQLAELGQLAAPQLADAVKKSTDPEVSRRAQALLDEMGE